MTALPSYLPTWECPDFTVQDKRLTGTSMHTPPPFPQTGAIRFLVEDYRPGYPRFTALFSAHNPYFLCRRFDRLRARLLLQKQDKLSILEERLEEVDHGEASPLYLGRSRSDRNAQRISLLSEIDASLADYDQFMERTNRILSFGPALPRDVESMKNWVESTGCLAREETAYLAHHGELISLAPVGDSAMVQLEAWLEDTVIRFWPNFQKRHSHISKDSNVHIYSGMQIQYTARAILLLLIIILLLGPVVICNIVSLTLGRIIVVMAATAFFLLIISVLIKSKTIELILIGVTYATVLVGFVSGNNVIGG